MESAGLLPPGLQDAIWQVDPSTLHNLSSVMLQPERRKTSTRDSNRSCNTSEAHRGRESSSQNRDNGSTPRPHHGMPPSNTRTPTGTLKEAYEAKLSSSRFFRKSRFSSPWKVDFHKFSRLNAWCNTTEGASRPLVRPYLAFDYQMRTL
jgi:hypothetical protein